VVRTEHQPFAYVEQAFSRDLGAPYLPAIIEQAYQWACDQRLIKFYFTCKDVAPVQLQDLNFEQCNDEIMVTYLTSVNAWGEGYRLFFKMSKYYLRDKIYRLNPVNKAELEYSRLLHPYVQAYNSFVSKETLVLLKDYLLQAELQLRGISTASALDEDQLVVGEEL